MPPGSDARRLPPLRRALLCLAPLLLVAGSWGEARFEWRDVVQEVDIQPDGTVVVEDERTLWTDEDFGEAFICLQHGANVTVRLLEGSGAVDDGPPTRAYTQPCESGTAGTEIVVENDERVTERRVRFVYAMTGTVDAYGDVVQWYWNVIPLDHPVIYGYTLAVTAPGPMARPYDAYVHRYGNPEEPVVALTDDRSRLTVAFDVIPSGDGVEIRWLMPPDLFETTGSGAQLEALLREEAAIANIGVPGAPQLRLPSRLEASSEAAVIRGTASDPDGIARVVAGGQDQERVACEGTTSFLCDVRGLGVGTTPVTVLAYDRAGNIAQGSVLVRRLSVIDQVRRSWLWALVPLLLVGWLAANIIQAYRSVGMEPHVDEMRYPFEPPSDLPPAAVTALRSQNFSSGGMGNAFHATIMDLARRGFGTFAGDKRKFEMTLHPERGDGPLLPFEERVLSFLQAAAAGNRRGDDAYLEFSELKSYSQRRGQGFMGTWGADVRAWVEQERGGPLVTDESRKVSRRWVARSLLAAGVCFAGIFLTSGGAMGVFVAGTAACIALLIVSAQALPSWRPEIAREVARWNGFQRTLTDYTRMKDAPPDFFRLWDVYFCYAAAMGVAKRFLQTLERAAPLAGVDNATLLRQSTWLGPSAHGATSISALSVAASQLSSALSTASASASSGGSSSGGGGGGGGGGSSGGR